MPAPEAEPISITRSLMVTDPGVRAAGLLDRVVAALGARAQVTI
jgi:alcohol dehydrogenase class IV